MKFEEITQRFEKIFIYLRISTIIIFFSKRIYYHLMQISVPCLTRSFSLYFFFKYVFSFHLSLFRVAFCSLFTLSFFLDSFHYCFFYATENYKDFFCQNKKKIEMSYGKLLKSIIVTRE